MEQASGPEQPAGLSASAARGVGVLVARTLGLQLVTAGVTIVLARLLTPSDYGYFAVALAAQQVGLALAELGLPAALIREEQDPTPHQQRAVRAATIAGGIALAALAALVAFAILPAAGSRSKLAEVTAVALVAIPIYGLRTVPMALLERNLRFGRVAIVEAAETFIFNGFALIAAAAGLGAYSLAGAVPVAAVAGTIAAMRVQPTARGFVFDLAAIRPLVGFGARVSLLTGLFLVRELVFVAALTAAVGVAAAGFYAMARRLFAFPVALGYAIGRVSFPALSREGAQRALRAARTAALSALVAGLAIALVAGPIQPLIAVLLGDRWLPSADIVLAGSAGLLIAASANPAMLGLLLAEGRPDPAIVALAVESTVLAVGAVFLGDISFTGIGITLTLAALANCVIVSLPVESEARAGLRGVAVALCITAAAVGAAQLLDLPNNVAGLAAGLGVAGAVWLAGSLLLARTDLKEAVRFARPMLRLRRAGA